MAARIGMVTTIGRLDIVAMEKAVHTVLYPGIFLYNGRVHNRRPAPGA